MTKKSAKIRCWLMKSEPDVFSIDDLQRLGKTAWEGVRNYTARNSMRDDMKIGDLVIFYHSSVEPAGAVGLARVCSAPYPDPTQFDEKSEYHDPKATREAPRWILVDVEFVEKWPAMVTLQALKADKKLKDMLVVQKGQRLSVQAVEPRHFVHVLQLAGSAQGEAVSA
ncbi:EVE domain-containing protein [Nannocystis bainbridge]|uniref:EVE domain-containing protein n=1 Tax=Nannocystis bainbridge TaxID=2995303 RepID=A0ABT5EAR4_9BACT|nr:EVE domain-containing protein [Nannocystis bainbridge]MDC0722954.1 EVE domain-containing protein [Nannocystis bainbridge]